MGWEIDEDTLPLDPANLSVEVQQALILLNALPDKWEGMSGSWLGKDYSGLGDILDIYDIENRREVFELLKTAENELSTHYEEMRKQQSRQQESMSRLKGK